MIIRFPTALYKPIIPQKPADSGSVTFTISNDDPPRSSLVFSELPPAIEQRRRAPRTIEPSVRREAVEERAFTILRSGQSNVGTNKKLVEVGQILEFTAAPSIDLEPMLVSDKNMLQHDTNILDLSGLGISSDDLDTINNSAPELLSQLNNELNVLIGRRDDIEIELSENKKTQNENTKAVNAIQVLVANGQDNLSFVVDDLTLQGESLAQREAELIAEANSAADQAKAKIDTIRELTQVVR